MVNFTAKIAVLLLKELESYFGCVSTFLAQSFYSFHTVNFAAFFINHINYIIQRHCCHHAIQADLKSFATELDVPQVSDDFI